MSNKKILIISGIAIIIIASLIGGLILTQSKKDDSKQKEEKRSLEKIKEKSDEDISNKESGLTTDNSEKTNGDSKDSSDWSRYNRSTLKKIINDNTYLLGEEAGNVADYIYNSQGIEYPYKVELVYKGKYRDILSQRMDFLKKWSYSLGVDEQYLKLYDSEALFFENGNEYWMPIQSNLIPFIKEEVKSGDRVDAFLMLVGAYRESGEFSWIFIVNEFKSL